MKNVVEIEKNGSKIALKILKITPDLSMESNEFYAAAFERAISKNFPFKEQLRKVLEERGLLDTKADDAKSTVVRKELKELEIKLRKGIIDGRRMTKLEGKELALKIRSKRQELSTIGSGISDVFSQTIESYADNERLKYLIYACAVHADSGKRYWPSFEAFINEPDSDLVESVTKAFIAAMAGVDHDFDKATYENKWLISQGFMNKDYQFIREDGKAVDEEGRLIDSEGRFINEAGEYIDIYGNKVDKDGNLLIEDTWGVSASEQPKTTP